MEPTGDFYGGLPGPAAEGGHSGSHRAFFGLALPEGAQGRNAVGLEEAAGVVEALREHFRGVGVRAEGKGHAFLHRPCENLRQRMDVRSLAFELAARIDLPASAALRRRPERRAYLFFVVRRFERSREGAVEADEIRMRHAIVAAREHRRLKVAEVVSDDFRVCH